ncbi:MAG: hypothetical protein IPM79_37285 [Polyangiaceae bacterium]|nr:hypothetical protein [Polyangiaceae bacterium]MBK8943107.1 hypothetical protein [Polyangiaceae bacterium]
MRVQRNARERGLELAARSAGAASEPSPGVAEVRAPELAEAAPARSYELRPEVDWTTLLRDEPGLVSQQVASTEGAQAPAEVEQAPAEVEQPERAPEPEERVGVISTPRERLTEEEAPSPASELELAIRAHAERRELPRELWSEAVYELRERRSTLPPAMAPAPEPQAASEEQPFAPPPVTLASPPLSAEPQPEPPVVPTPAAAVVPGPTLAAVPLPAPALAPASAPVPVPAPAPPIDLEPMDALFESQGSDRPEPRRRGWLLALGLAVLAALSIGVAVQRFRGPETRGSASVPSATAGSGASSDLASPSTRSSSARSSGMATSARSSAAPEAAAPLATAATSTPQPTATAVASAPPPAITDPQRNGLLWIETETPADVYLRGVRVGKSGEHLELPCGMGFVRLAAPGSVPAGESFPAWRGEGKAVFVPCGEAHRTRL